MITREVGWGDAIVVELFKTVGGLKVTIEAIQSELGPTIGNRNTFAKLLRMDDPADLNDKDRWRAWLLLTALRQTPEDWGISNDIVPGLYDPELIATRLHELVRPKGFEPLTSWSVADDAATWSFRDEQTDVMAVA